MQTCHMSTRAHQQFDGLLRGAKSFQDVKHRVLQLSGALQSASNTSHDSRIGHIENPNSTKR